MGWFFVSRARTSGISWGRLWKMRVCCFWFWWMAVRGGGLGVVLVLVVLAAWLFIVVIRVLGGMRGRVFRRVFAWGIGRVDIVVGFGGFGVSLYVRVWGCWWIF